MSPRRPTREPRNYFSRREQGRLLMLVMALGLAVILFNQSRKPENWRLFFPPSDAASADRPAASRPATAWEKRIGSGDHAAQPASPSSADERDTDKTKPSNAKKPPAAADSGRYFPGVRPKLLETIRDKSRFRSAEQDAWFHLFAILKTADPAALRRASVGRVTRLQLAEQSASYRGEVVTVRGTVRRAHWLPASKNDFNISGYYQLWIQPDDAPEWPLVVYCLELPKKFPTGMTIDRPAVVTGFYFKRWLHASGDGLQLSPVVLARDIQPITRPTRPTRTEGRSSLEKPNDIGPATDAARNVPALDSRQLMRLAGIDDAQWARFEDGRPWNEPQQETLQKILLRLAALPVEDVERLARPSIDWKRLRSDPGEYRGQIVRLHGRIQSLDVLSLSEEMAQRFGVKRYYRIELMPDDAPGPVVVFARTIPRAWQAGGRVDQPAGAWAMFVTLEGNDAAGARPAFAAARVAWYPSDRLLGRLGMDVGLLDELVDSKPLRAEERECFYQALAAAERSKPGQLRDEAARQLARTKNKRYSVEPLFNAPARQRGRLVILSGTARRALRVRVEEPDIRRRLGIDHYYEIYLSTDDSQRNPVVFCVGRLPEGMPTGEGPGYAEAVTVAGFFLKSWAYASGLSARPGQGDRSAPLQLAPLLVGREAVWHKSKPPAASLFWGSAAAVALMLVLLGIWFWLRKSNRRRAVDSRRRKPTDTAGSLGDLGRQ
ncbi:MAG TPA: hypothetical protein VJL29_06195 [Thermoguttaceae bacterium]|nr:hypothetical protein [Thermoguttaceae bacterium]